MKPLLISTSDKGGAANSCLRLHQGLLKQNIDSKVLLKHKTNSNLQETYKISLQALSRSIGAKISDKLIRLLKELNLYKEQPDQFIANRPKGLELFSYPESNYDITKSELYQQADLINLHWVANFLDYPSFFKKNKKPVVWTLHDQNPFTGGEHYTEMSLGMDKNGYPIKRVITKQEIEKFKKIFAQKRNALEGIKNLTIVSPSMWLSEEAKKSDIFCKHNVKTIPYGLDSNVFKPLNKQYSRELLNIPQDKKVLLFVSDSVSNKRKGFEYLLKAFEKLNNKETLLLSIGSKNAGLLNNKNLIELGFVSDELLMSVIYSAADVFVIPSLMDNLPNTVMESIMCGTPVIGFPVGGIHDMIQDGENGYLTEEISAPALAKTIDKFFENPVCFDRDKITKNAVKKYDISVQANAYNNLYKSIMNV